MRTKSSHIKKGPFLLLWIGINLAGWAAWIGFSTIPIFARIQSSSIVAYIGLLVIGGSLGILQWLLLKRRFSIVGYEWIILTIIGFAIGLYSLIWAALRDFYIVFSPPQTPVLEWDPLLGGALLGLALGCCQGIVWRPHYDRVAVWIVVNMLGWSLGMFLPQLIAYLLPGVNNTPWLSTLFPVAAAAVAVGIVLVWFSTQQHHLELQT